MGTPLGYPGQGIGVASPWLGRLPVDVAVARPEGQRDRLTSFFRPLLAIPHLLLVGGPIALAFAWQSDEPGGLRVQWLAAGALGAVAAVCALVSWFAIVFTGKQPEGLWSLTAFYLRWRVHAVAYIALLRDEYPPFGDGAYPASLLLAAPTVPRDRLTVAFRPILALPHLLIVWALGLAWAVTTLLSWFAILFTGHHPEPLHRFGAGVLRWSTRVEAYVLLLHDAYPPFSLA